MGTDSRSTAIFTKRVLIAITLVVFVLLLLALLYYTFDVILLVFAAALIAILLRGLADLLGRFVKIGEGWLVLTISVAAIGVFAVAVAGLAPSIAEQMAHLRDELPRSVEAARVYLTRFG